MGADAHVRVVFVLQMPCAVKDDRNVSSSSRGRTRQLLLLCLRSSREGVVQRHVVRRVGVNQQLPILLRGALQ